ncbi:MAG TPA: hypothetical protein VKM55_11445 [Candidatus Lokiarchaeia archaeon]|nr:hypothetical protein [Candidatus Lokiarchaeia archaeon]
MEQENDRMGAANIHLMIVDMEKLKAKATQAKSTSEPGVQKKAVSAKPTKPISSAQVTVPQKPVKPVKSATAASKVKPAKPTPAKQEDPLETWEEGKRLLKSGDKFAASQKFLIAKRAALKAGKKDLAKKIDQDIARIKGTKDSEAFRAVDDVAMAPEPVKETTERTPQQMFSTSQPAEMYPIFKKALADKDKGNYAKALEGFKECYDMAVGPEKREIEKQISKLEQLVSMKAKINSGMTGSGGFVTVGQESSEQSDSIPIASEGEHVAAIARQAMSTAGDPEERAKLEKRKEAEQLIVEAENMENSNDAIEKLKDAAHLFLVTGTRLDRVEWIYDKVNQIKSKIGQQKTTLFEVEKFPSSMLREYAFQRIDLAKNKIRYGKYKDAVELYKQCVKALTEAEWTQEQINYIINDMIAVRRDQDRVEQETELMQEIIDREITYLVDKIDTWRAGEDVGIAPEQSFDEDIHLPGREKTVEEKRVEKVIAIQAERQRLKKAMDDSMEEARHMTTMGDFQEAINLYNNAIKIMDQLGGWESQKGILVSEIENLKQLYRRQQEILHEQKNFAKKGSSEGRADLEEKSFLIKKAAVLNQENLKEKLLMKRARDEMEQTVFEILIPAANKLKEEGKLDDALVEFKEAVKMLTEAGWTTQTQSLRDEIADLETAIGEEKIGSKKTRNEKQAIRTDVFENIIPSAREAVLDGDYFKGKELYEEAVENLLSIGWDEYIKPILENIHEIEEKLSKQKAIDENITEEERSLVVREEVEMGMRFLAKDMKKYALLEFNKAIALLENMNDNEMLEELRRQVKKIELEIKLEESKKLLVDRKKST